MQANLLALTVCLVISQSGCAPLAPRDPGADSLTLTTANGPLPAAAFKAQITFAYEPPGEFRTAEETGVHVLVKNRSAVVWPSGAQPDGKYQVRIGNRWWDANGNVFNDGGGPLDYDLHPGETIEALVRLTAPKLPGDYLLEIDLFQEQIVWFSEHGSETLRLSVKVR